MSVEEISLRGCRILIVEDDFLVATALAGVIEARGAEVVGPVGKVQQALELISRGERIDAALLDVHLGTEAVYPVADVLQSKGIPMVFTTGYESADLPPTLSAVPTLQKPVGAGRVLQVLRAQIDSAAHRKS